MKVKIEQTFISGMYYGRKGETIDLPQDTARRLIKLGYVTAAAASTPKKAEK